MRSVLHTNWRAQVPPVPEALREAAWTVVATAQARAPRNTGAGAASIHAEAAGPNAYRVGWDRAHDYMRFPEFGTEHQPARPFLRPAAASAATTK